MSPRCVLQIRGMSTQTTYQIHKLDYSLFIWTPAGLPSLPELLWGSDEEMEVRYFRGVGLSLGRCAMAWELAPHPVSGGRGPAAPPAHCLACSPHRQAFESTDLRTSTWRGGRHARLLMKSALAPCPSVCAEEEGLSQPSAPARPGSVCEASWPPLARLLRRRP